MMALALLPLGWAGWLGAHDANWWPLALILLMSLLTLVVYAWDKRQAIRGGWRVPEARLRTIGLGEQRPVAPNAAADGSDDEAGRQRNRRVEVVLPTAAPATQAAAGATSSLEPAN